MTTGTTGEVVIQTAGLSKSYGRTSALVDVDLEVHRGEVFGYLGPNGAGKTTTLRLLLGLLRPTRGQARVLGLDSWRQAPAVHARVGYVPGDPALYDKLTGRALTRYLGSLRGCYDGDGSLRGCYDGAHVAALAQRLDLDLDRPAGTLSKGNRQKLILVLAMMHRPELLLLDEPTSGLDPLVQVEFLAMMREHVAEGGSVLLSSHVLDEVQRVADRVGIIRAGRLVAIERLETLRARSLHRLRAHLADGVNLSEFAEVPDLHDLRLRDGVLTCSAPQSSLDALVKRLAAHEVLDLACEEAGLEETFLTYYGAPTEAGASYAGQAEDA